MTELDMVRNGRISGTTKMGEISKEARYGRWKLYTHVMRSEEHYGGRRAMGTEVQWGRKGRRKRRWLTPGKRGARKKRIDE